MAVTEPQAKTKPDTDKSVPISFSEQAAIKIKSLIKEEGNDALKLRVFVAGGGCSGFQYGFTFEDDADEDDLVLSAHDVTMLVDPMSAQYLIGAQIDYQEKLEGSQFVIHNPNVTFYLRVRLVI